MRPGHGEAARALSGRRTERSWQYEEPRDCHPITIKGANDKCNKDSEKVGGIPFYIHVGTGYEAFGAPRMGEQGAS
ncbi:hypothetical protein ACCO45_006988 [Purpureocillium lilacinum]|uniref:Uncharacterized protein n=1 Tax=Purpureocillium lilacinum TaxID=33203 RepID=A0ACC4DTS6_PURLI